MEIESFFLSLIYVSLLMLIIHLKVYPLYERQWEKAQEKIHRNRPLFEILHYSLKIFNPSLLTNVT